jgi:hypothetical protein
MEILVALLVPLLLPAQEAEKAPEKAPEEAREGLGAQVVQVRQAVYYKKSSRLGGILRKAEYREEVEVTEIQGRFSKCTLKDGTEAWILSSALIPAEKFKPGASTEEELKALKAEGYEAGRFSPETEKKVRSESVGSEQAYQELDSLEARLPDPISREERLRKFREQGNLGEYSGSDK